MHYRGIEFEVVEVSRFKWRWTIYPKKSLNVGAVTRVVDRGREGACPTKARPPGPGSRCLHLAPIIRTVND